VDQRAASHAVQPSPRQPLFDDTRISKDEIIKDKYYYNNVDEHTNKNDGICGIYLPDFHDR
jgi:hypothetical protein